MLYAQKRTQQRERRSHLNQLRYKESCNQCHNFWHMVHTNSLVYLEVQYIVGFLMDSDRLSCPECKTMSATERHDEQLPVWRHMYDDVIIVAPLYRWKFKMSKHSHVIYRWITNFIHIDNRNRTWGQKSLCERIWRHLFDDVILWFNCIGQNYNCQT